jgi:putative ABC transport system permease protein
VNRLRFAAGYQRDIAPLFTIWLLLALGLGTTALLYTALAHLLLHPLPISHPETLVKTGENYPPVVVYWTSFPYSTYQAMLGMHTLESVAAESTLNTVLTQGESSIPIVAQMVSGNYFSVLGVTAEQGRTLAPPDDRPGAGEISIVLSHRFFSAAIWKLSIQTRPISPSAERSILNCWYCAGTLLWNVFGFQS